MNWYKQKFADADRDAEFLEFINQKYYDGEDIWSEEQKKDYRAMHFLESEIADAQRVVVNIMKEQTPFNKRILDIFESYIGKTGGDYTDILYMANSTIQEAHNKAEITYPDLVTAVKKLEFLISEYDKIRDKVHRY